MATDPRIIVNEDQDPGLVHPTGYIPTQGVTNGTNEVKTVTINYTDPPLYGVPELQIFNDPGGRNGAVQFNVGNRLGGDSNFVWNSKNRTLSILGNIRISDSIIGKYNTNTKNLKISGGEDGYVLSTDGTGNLSWVAQTGGGGTNYANSNVAAYLPTYTGNISAGNISVAGITNLGSVGNVKITGGTANYVLHTDGAGNLSWVAPQAGPQGNTGADGNAATITLGNVTTGNAGSSVQITNTGNTSAAVFNFTIPKGDHGDIGPEGPQGIQGEQGIQGVPGATGPQGNIGPQGIQGIQGPIGNTGAQGVSVTLQGTVANVIDLPPVGTAGDGYIVSASGNLYFWAPVGSQWEDIGPIVGPEGPRGEQGIQGETGLQGNIGPQGVQGDQGIEGPQGPQGEIGPGVAPGGSTGQVLVKSSDTDYDTAWQDQSITTINIDDVAPNSAVDGAVWWSSEAGRSYIKYNDQWVDMSPQTPINPDIQVTSITFEDGTVQTSSSDLGNLAVGDSATLYDKTSLNNLNMNEGGFGEVSLRSFRNDVKIISDYINTSSTWRFSGDGNLVLPSGGKIGAIQFTNGVELYSEGHQYTQLNYENRNFVWADEYFTGIQTGNAIWAFTEDGNITFPDGTVQETAYTGETNSKVIVSDTPPANVEQGVVWFNSQQGRTYVKYNDQWVDSSPQIVPPDPANPFDQDLNTTDNVTFNDINAANLQINDLDTTVLAAGLANIENLNIGNNLSITNISTGNVTANYFIGDGSLLTNIAFPTTNNAILVSDIAPNANIEGRLWFNSVDGKTYVTYNNQWVDSNPQTIDARALRIDNDDYVATPNNRIVIDDIDANMIGINTVSFSDNTYQTTAYLGPATLLDGGGANSTYTGNIPPGGIPNPFDQELNTTDNVIFSRVTASEFVGNISLSNVSGLGNIATVNLNNSSSTVLYGNGVFAPVSSTFPNVTTDNFRINGEGKGLIVDAADLKRFGFMKYAGIEGSIVHSAYTGAAVPFRIGRVSTANVTDATVSEFTTEIYVGTNGHVRIADDNVNNINDPTERLEVSGNIKTSGNIIYSDNTVQSTAWTGTISTGNVTGLGNIATINIDGVSSHVLYGNGTWASVGSANTGNIGFLNTDIYSLNGITLENADLTHGATSALIIPSNGSTSAVQLNNFYGDITVSASNSGAGGLKTWRFGSGNLAFPDLTIQNTAWTGTVSTSNVTGLGNIATVNLDGNANTILYGNGTFAAAPTSGSNYSNSNVSTFLSSFGSNTISTTGNVSVGNINFSSNNYTLNFATGAYISGNANSLTRDGSILLQPYTGAGSTFPGVIIGGAGRLLAPNGGVFQIFNASDVTFQATIKSTLSTAATSTTTGALIIPGGAGLAGSITTGVGALLTGPTFTPLANTMAGFVSNVNSYTQLTIQNKSTGADATTDFVATADNGSDTVNYLDLGIINSGYDNLTPTNSLGNIVYAADSYLYAQGNVSNTSQSGGNLAIGTTVAGKSVKIFAGGANANSIVATISNTGLAVTGNVTATNFSGNISITGNVTGTSPNVTLVAGSYSYTFDNTGILTLPAGGGNEGGEIDFIKAPNSTLSGSSVVIDQYIDRIRFFEGGGTTRGAYIDLTQAAAGVATLLNNRVSGLVNAGTFVTMDLIKATVTTTGNRGLSLAATTGSFAIYIAGNYATSGGANGSSGSATITTTPSNSQFNWNFTGAGDIATYIITDTTNSRAYRITLQIGASYNNNMISIERLV